MERLHGQIVALYLFDVAEADDLQRAASAVGGGVRARFAPKPATPAYVRYQQPPLWFGGVTVELPTIDAFALSFTAFDYGVISLRLTRNFSGTWAELAEIAHQLVESEALERRAEQACGLIADRLTPALAEPREAFLSEDYLVFAVIELSHRHTADDLVEHDGHVIASMLRDERAPLAVRNRRKSSDTESPAWRTIS